MTNSIPPTYLYGCRPISAQRGVSGLGFEPVTTAALVTGGSSILGSLWTTIFGDKAGDAAKKAAATQLKAAKIAQQTAQIQAAADEAKAKRTKMLIWGGVAAVGIVGLVLLRKSRRK